MIQDTITKFHMVSCEWNKGQNKYNLVKSNK